MHILLLWQRNAVQINSELVLVSQFTSLAFGFAGMLAV